VAAVLVREGIDERSLRLALLDLHRSLGVLILALTGLRLLTRVLLRQRGVDHGLSPMVALAAALGHLGLYALMVGVPLLGWALNGARGIATTVFGFINLPQLIAENADLADKLADAHEIAAWTLIVLIGLHVAAALWHHIFLRDGVMRAMAPWLGESSPQGHRPQAVPAMESGQG